MTEAKVGLGGAYGKWAGAEWKKKKCTVWEMGQTVDMQRMGNGAE